MSWPVSRLGEVISFIRGVTFTPEDQVEPFSEGSTVVMRTKNVQVAGLDQSDLIAVPSGFVRRKEQELREGDILVSSANSWELVGKASYVPKLTYEATAGGFISIVRAKESRIDSRYLYHWVACPATQHKIRHCGRQTTNISNLDVGRFQDLEIPLPPLPEQKRIAAILDKADAIRRKRQQAIQLADDFLRAVFLEMFGDPVTNPKGWEVRPLSELVSKLGDGLHGTPKYDESGDYYFINGNNLDSGSIVISERVKRVGDEEFKRHKKELTKNTMLVSINGTIGKVAFYQGEKVILGKSVCYFNVIPECISPIYLYHLIGSHYFLRYTGGIETGSTIKNVSLKSMREFPVPVPSANLQGRFEVLVKRIESKKAKLFAGHNSAGALFDSLSQNAFSGQL